MLLPSTPSYRITFCWFERPLKRMLSKLPLPLFTAPGASRYSCETCRPFSGSSATSRSLTFTPMRALLVSICARLPPSTVTAVLTAPTCSTMSRVTSCPTCSVSPLT